jgi:hypothetical protein
VCEVHSAVCKLEGETTQRGEVETGVSGSDESLRCEQVVVHAGASSSGGEKYEL